MRKIKVCICGGGNLGHVLTGFLSAREDCEVSLLTRHPERWQKQILISKPDGNMLRGNVCRITNQPSEIIPEADVVLLCLPGFSIREELQLLKPFIQPQTAVGSIVSSTGFFFEAFELLPVSTPLFGFQRVPFIARTTEYGRSADLLGFKPELQVAIEHTTDPEPLRALLERLLATPTILMKPWTK